MLKFAYRYTECSVKLSYDIGNSVTVTKLIDTIPQCVIRSLISVNMCVRAGVYVRVCICVCVTVYFYSEMLDGHTGHCQMKIKNVTFHIKKFDDILSCSSKNQ